MVKPGEPEEGLVRVEERGEGRFAQRIRAGKHTLNGDEPASAGGTGTGPNPYDYLLASLGACTSMTLRLYAERKGWPLEKVAVTLRHDRIYAQDCAECGTREGRVDRIERVLELSGPLSPEQKARLLEIAEKCPVHRTLKSEIVIRSSLAA